MTDTPTPPTNASDVPPDWEALARHQAGESPEPEARAVAAWLAAHPEDARLLASLDAALARAASDAAPVTREGDVDVEAALRRVQARRDATADPDVGARDVLPMRPRLAARTRGATLPPTRTLVRRLVGGLAAAAAIGALAVGLSRRAGDDGSAPAASAGAARVVAAGAELTTAVGVRDSVRLPDGTGIVLAPGSRLAVAADYGAARREVTLDGAALFTVRHDTARPFTVRAGDALVRDVGTRFVVRTDGVDEPRGVAVSVAEGAVALRAATAAASAGDTGVLLAAGDRGELRADGRVVAARGAATDDDVAWTRGRLAYTAAPLDVVRADLRRWYGVELRVADSALARRRLTATFEGDSVSRVLDVVALALGATVDRNGSVAVLRRATPSATGAATHHRRGGTR